MWLFASRKTGQSKPARRVPPSYRPRLEGLEDRCLLSAGALDPTFGSGGVVTNVPANAGSVAVQTDGKILDAGGFNTNTITVSRYTTSGALDTSFGSGGTATVKVFSNSNGHAFLGGIAVDSSGRIVLGGGGNVSSGFNFQQYFVLTRLTSGSLDKTFGNKGVVLTPSTGGPWNNPVVIQPDGKILLGSTSSIGPVLARYNANGSLDSSFGSGGLATFSWGADARFVALTLQSDGKLLAGGEQRDPTDTFLHFAIARFTANGSLDNTFGPSHDGKVTTAIDESSRVDALLVQLDSKIVAAGNASHRTGKEVALARYDASGNLDPTFGIGGIVLTPTTVAFGGDVLRGAVLQSDGKIVTAGYHDDSGLFFQVERYTPSGALDGTFGNGGIVTTTIVSSRDNAGGNTVALQANGAIVVAGPGALFRLLPSSPQVGSFTANPNPVAAGSSVTLTASNIVDLNPNSTVTQVAFYRDSNGDGVLQPGTDALLGYATQTSPGVWTLTITVSLAPGSYTLFAQAKDNYSVFGDPLALNLQVL